MKTILLLTLVAFTLGSFPIMAAEPTTQLEKMGAIKAKSDTKVDNKPVKVDNKATKVDKKKAKKKKAKKTVKTEVK